jgi:hypothetical protein
MRACTLMGACWRRRRSLRRHQCWRHRAVGCIPALRPAKKRSKEYPPPAPTPPPPHPIHVSHKTPVIIPSTNTHLEDADGLARAAPVPRHARCAGRVPLLQLGQRPAGGALVLPDLLLQGPHLLQQHLQGVGGGGGGVMGCRGVLLFAAVEVEVGMGQARGRHVTVP